jgi:hypothetical protein
MPRVKGTNPKLTVLKPVELTEEQVQVYDRLKRAEAQLSRMRKAEKRARQARKLLDEAFGAAALGVSPDGRLIQRTRRQQHYDPLPAKEVQWSEFNEIAPWDAS